MLNASIERNIWDEAAMLYILSAPEPGDDEAQLSMALLAGGVRPPQMVFALSERVRLGDVALVPDTALVGLALQAEAWIVVTRPGPENEAVEKIITDGGTLATHKDRIEVKQISAWDGHHQTTVQYSRERGKEVMPVDAMTGNIPDSLVALFNAIKEKQ